MHIPCPSVSPDSWELYTVSSRVPAVLVQRNSTNAYIYCQSLLPESLPQASPFYTYPRTAQKKIFLDTIYSPRIELRTVFVLVTLVPVISSPKQTILFFVPSHRAHFPSYWNHLHRDSNPGQLSGMSPFCYLLFESNNFGLDAVFLLCLVSELHETSSPGLELRALFLAF
jgi:hypothetical protein